MDDITTITLITILYGFNTVAMAALYSKINKVEITIARLCVRMGCTNDH